MELPWCIWYMNNSSKPLHRYVPVFRNGEESPDNTEHRTSEMEDVREGIVSEKRMTAPIRTLQVLPGKICISPNRSKGEKAG